MENYPTKIDYVSTEPAAEYNDLTTELKNAVTNTGQVLSSSDAHQLSRASAIYSTSGSYYVDSGTPNIHVLSPIGNMQSPPSYQDGMKFRFISASTNTNVAVTVNVAGLGVKVIFGEHGGQLFPGDIVVGNMVQIYFDSALAGGTGGFFIQNLSVVSHIPGFRSGFDLGYHAANEIDISAGIAMDHLDDRWIRSNFSSSKRTDLPWSAGSTHGGMASAVTLAVDTWYPVAAILDSTLFMPDFGFDDNVNFTNLMTDAVGYVTYKHIGWFKTEKTTTDVKEFLFFDTGFGRYYLWVNPENDIYVNDPGTAAVIAAISVPPSANIIADINTGVDHSAGTPPLIYVSNPDVADNVPTPGGNGVNEVVATSGRYQVTGSCNTNLKVIANNLSQIRYRISTSSISVQLTLTTLGWYEK